MFRNSFQISSLFLLIVLCSCGPKKGIVTKKKDQRERTEVREEQEIVQTEVEESKRPQERQKREEQRQEKKETPPPPSPPRTPKSNNAVDIYIAKYADISMTEMRRYKIPASITLAQGILESGSGKGRLALEANNHFGIKCHGWKGERIYHDDDRSKECFRKYDDPNESYEDHSKFLTERRRYASLFDLREDDYKAWARGLKKAGYATDRSYPKKLIALIQMHKLYEFDKEVLKGSKQKPRRRPDPEPPKPEPRTTISSYVVKQGDTLYSLSRRFGMSVTELKSLNGLTGSTINIGQTLKVLQK